MTLPHVGSFFACSLTSWFSLDLVLLHFPIFSGRCTPHYTRVLSLMVSGHALLYTWFLDRVADSSCSSKKSNVGLIEEQRATYWISSCAPQLEQLDDRRQQKRGRQVDPAAIRCESGAWSFLGYYSAGPFGSHFKFQVFGIWAGFCTHPNFLNSLEISELNFLGIICFSFFFCATFQ